MTASAISAIGVDPVSSATSKISEQVANAARQTDSGSSVQTTIPAAEASNSLNISAGSQVSGGENGFMSSVLDGVYSEMDSLSSKVPSFSESSSSAVDSYMEKMSPADDSVSAMEKTGTEGSADETVKALSKTFDHAIFMAMVNQVISGVGDTSRTLIRQQ